MVGAYREHCARRRYARTTIDARFGLLARLSRAGVDLRNTTPDELEGFFAARHLSDASLSTELAGLSAFYEWAIGAGFVESNPTRPIVRPRRRRYQPRPARSADIAVAVEMADPVTRAMILLAALAGLRCMEIAGLRWSDVDLGGAFATVRGKGGHERIVDLHALCVSTLASLPRAGMYVFVGYAHGGYMSGERRVYSPNQVSKRINEHLRGIGIQWTAHQLRHWYGTELYRKTKDLRMVQSLMGHASPATTAVYTAFDRTDSKRATDELTFGAAQSPLFII